MVYSFIKASGDTCKEKLRSTITPSIVICEKCGEHYCEHNKASDFYEIQPMLDVAKYGNGVLLPDLNSVTATPPKSIDGNSAG